MQTHPSYEILQEIGRGPEATVYRARDLDRKRIVAIKEFDPRWSQAKAQSFWDEAQSFAALAHENLVKIYAVDKERGWLVLELLQGGLDTRLLQGPLAPELVRGLLRQALQGLQALHERKKSHGAIKPANLFLHESGQVKISDPAGVRAAGTLSRRAGTCKYLAPEILNPEFGPLGAGVDLYSLGFVALELLKGPGFDQLFQDSGSKSIDPEGRWLRLHGSAGAKMPGVRDVLPSTPEDLVHVIERLLQRQVSQRYRSAYEALGDLDTCLGPGVGVHPSSSGRGSATPVVPSSQHAIPPGLSDTNIPMAPPRLTQAMNPLCTGSAPVSRPSFYRGLEKPLVLYPLCALIILLTAVLLFYHPVPAETEKNLVRVRIDSQPEGARVLLDDREIQASKDGTFPLKPGDYLLRLELDKHKPLERPIEVKPGLKEQAFPFILEKAEPEYQVRLRSDPPGASVFIDGSYRPGLTNEVWSLPAGEHHILVVHPKIGIAQKDVVVEAKAGAGPQEIDFKPLPISGIPNGSDIPGRPRALVVGIQEYGSALPAFRHGAGDAIDLAHTLRAVGYKDEAVVLLTQPHGRKNPDLMPTAEGIRRELARLATDSSPRDTVIVALAGLVIQPSRGGRLCLLSCRRGGKQAGDALAAGGAFQGPEKRQMPGGHQDRPS